MRRVAMFVVGMLLVGACAASAQQACQAEVEKFCKGVKMGESRVTKCLQAHDKDLSDACRARVNTLKQFMACVDDVMQFCPGEAPVGGEAIMCLREHETDLSTACKNELRVIRPN